LHLLTDEHTNGEQKHANKRKQEPNGLRHLLGGQVKTGQ
jgi:hypothetical protein